MLSNNTQNFLSAYQRYKLGLVRASFPSILIQDVPQECLISYGFQVQCNISRHGIGGTPGHQVHGNDDGALGRYRGGVNDNDGNPNVITCKVLGRGSRGRRF